MRAEVMAGKGLFVLKTTCFLLVPTRFAVGTICLRRIAIAVLPITCSRAADPIPRCQPIPAQIGNSTCLEATSLQPVFR